MCIHGDPLGLAQRQCPTLPNAAIAFGYGSRTARHDTHTPNWHALARPIRREPLSFAGGLR